MVGGRGVVGPRGAAFDVAGRSLSSGSHTIADRAYDNATTDLVRQFPAQHGTD